MRGGCGGEAGIWGDPLIINEPRLVLQVLSPFVLFACSVKRKSLCQIGSGRESYPIICKGDFPGLLIETKLKGICSVAFMNASGDWSVVRSFLLLK